MQKYRDGIPRRHDDAMSYYSLYTNKNANLQSCEIIGQSHWAFDVNPIFGRDSNTQRCGECIILVFLFFFICFCFQFKPQMVCRRTIGVGLKCVHHT